MKPTLSVIIPCRNGVNYLAEAVASIRAQAVAAEIILADDGSSDGTAELAHSLGCRVIRQPPVGPARARNQGLCQARGEFVMFLDHDDVLVEGALPTLLGEFDGQTDIVAGKLKDFVSPELSHEEAAKLLPREKSYGGVLPGAYLFRRRVLDELGGFNEELPSGECVDFLLRCREQGIRIKQLEETTCRRRLHLTNTGRRSRDQEQKGYLSTLRSRLMRK